MKKTRLWGLHEYIRQGAGESVGTRNDTSPTPFPPNGAFRLVPNSFKGETSIVTPLDFDRNPSDAILKIPA